MSMDRRRPKVCIVVVACSLLVRCAPDAGAPGATTREGVQLLAGLRSYMTPADVQRSLAAGNDNWRVTYTNPGEPSGGIGPRNPSLRVEINAVECDQSGTLIVDFANSRLQKTTFVPTALETCLTRLGARGLTFEGSRDNRIGVTGTDPKSGLRFVALSDERLTKEVLEWVRRYT